MTERDNPELRNRLINEFANDLGGFVSSLIPSADNPNPPVLPPNYAGSSYGADGSEQEIYVIEISVGGLS